MDAGGRGEVVLEILGPFRAWRGESEVRVGAAKVRALASALALFAPESLTTEDLLEAVWGADPPATAKKALQTYVVHLRKLFGSDAVRTDVAGYALTSAVRTDRQQFEELLEPARSTPRRASAPDAGAAGTALSLWRGDPCPDLDWARATGAVQRLESLRDEAQEIVAESRAWSEEPAKWVTDLARLVEEAPLREKRWRLWMIALYRSGRQTEALRAYQRARTLLVEEIGVEPGRELRELEAAILRHDDALAARVRDDAASWEHDLQVGDEAHREDDYETAIAAYRRALAIGEGSGKTLARECDVLIRLAEAEYLAGDPVHRASAIAAARLATQLDDKELLARAALAAVQRIEAATRRIDPDRVAILRRAVDATVDGATRARLLGVLAAELNSSPDPSERRALSGLALDCAHASGDAGALDQVLAARAETIRGPDTVEERLANTAEHLMVVTETTPADRRKLWAAASNRALTCLEAGRVAESMWYDKMAGLIAEESNIPAAVWRARFVEARDLTRVGDLTAAEHRAREALRIGRAAGYDAMRIYVGQLYVLRWHQDRLDDVAGAIDHTTADDLLSRAFLGHALCKVGRTVDARRTLLGLATRHFDDVPLDGYWSTTLALAADVAADLDETAVMAELYDRMQRWPEVWVANPANFLGPMSHYLARLAAGLDRGREADHWFAVARAAYTSVPAPILEGYLASQWMSWNAGQPS